MMILHNINIMAVRILHYISSLHTTIISSYWNPFEYSGSLGGLFLVEVADLAQFPELQAEDESAQRQSAWPDLFSSYSI